MKEQLDFVAIGDITTDAFIRLKEARVNCNLDDEKCQLCVSFGDKIPYEFVEVVPAVGNSPNAAVCAARLGLKSALIANLGDDEGGKASLASLQRDGVKTHLVSVHPGAKSNYHFVLWYEAERTILVKHERYPYRLPEMEKPRFVYLSSLSEHAGVYQEEVSRYLKDHPVVRLAFQPGTFQIKLGYKKLRNLYERCELFFCNLDEARRILETEDKAVGQLLKGINAIGPKNVIITDGPRGAYAYSTNGMWFMPAYPDPKPPYERTGAGDAFASTVTAAIALGKNLEEALGWAGVNAMSVVQYIGAQKGLLTPTAIKEYLEKAGTEYTPRRIV